MTDAQRDIEIRPPTVGDLHAIGELYRTVKGRPRPEPVTRHRLFDTPWGDSIAHIALDGDLCVGMVVYWPVALRIAGEVVPGAQGMDAVTHPDYRGRPRLFLGLAKVGRDLTREQGIEVLYTFPNERSIKLTKHIGATYLGEVGAWGVELEARRLRLPKLGRTASEVVAATPDPAELDGLVAEAHSERDVVRIDKSPAWLAWRYSELSCERYEWLTLRNASGSLAAAALLGERDPESWGSDFAGIVRIHELFARDVQVAESLLRQAAGRVRHRGGRKLDILVKDPVLEQAVERAGFQREKPHPMTTLSHRTGPFSADTLDFARWRLISGDMDFF